MKPTEISNRVFRSKHTVTRVIDTLEKQGLVKRGPIGEDRRTRKVNITKKGLELIKRTSAEGRQRISHAIFLPLGQKQIKELSIILRHVRKHVLTLITHSKNKQG